MKNFALIGCGAIARIHAKAIEGIEGAKLVGVYDYSYTCAEKFAQEFSCNAYKSLEEMLANPEIDIVNICTPSGLHAEQTIAAAKAKKNIIVEKPMAITKEQLEKVVEAIKENEVKVEVITQLRFTPSICKLKKAIDEGRLGRILLADYSMKYYRSPEYYKQGGWRGTWKMDGGGALMNQGIHGIDLIQYLMGGVKSVYAQCRTLDRDIEVEDTATAILEFENGALGVIEGATCVSPGFDRKIEIMGTKGHAILRECEIEKMEIDGKVIVNKSNADLTNFGTASNAAAVAHSGHVMQITNLIRAIRGEEELLIDASEGRKAVKTICDIYASSARDV